TNSSCPLFSAFFTSMFFTLNHCTTFPLSIREKGHQLVTFFDKLRRWSFLLHRLLSYVRFQAFGGMTVAKPLMTTSPFWLVQTVSSFARFFSGMSSTTVAVAVMVSPKNTGFVKRSSWPM